MDAVFEERSIARAEQGYVTRPGTCGTCASLVFDVRHERGRRAYNQYESIPIRHNYRCGIGGFAVVTNATCAKHEAKKSTTRSSN
ncbi:hypothetical protein PQR39_35655 [Paraburkholderia sediminicola]|uniref:hypothetical protein n=1 Tax=Paraburkholderia sediminicola TaxID=458836 RepID=UPI0038BC3597